MQHYTSIEGSPRVLDYNDSTTWNVTVKLERVPKQALTKNQLQNLKFVIDPRVNQYEQAEEVESANAIITKLKELNPWTGQHLGLKAEILKPFDFRVLVGNDQPSDPAQRSSHICLSYSWWSQQWLESGKGQGFGLSPALRADAYNGKHEIPEGKFPISDSMWNALLAERSTESEGVWIDQLCIDQGNQAEIDNALLLMERIYKTARKVVVPLENVLLWSDEARAILKHIQAINNIPHEQRKDWHSWVRSADVYALGASAYALFKIEGSRWFRRVWCNHEMRMGNDFVFMVPVMERTTPEDHAEKVCIMKLDCKALITLIASCRTMNIGTGMTLEDVMLQGYFKETMIDFNLDRQPRAFIPAAVLAPDFDKFTPIREISVKARGERNSMVPILHTLSELTAYQTQHPRDVLHVFLDTIAPGLTYNNGIHTLSIAHIAFIMNVLALASGDLSPLTAPGRTKFWQDHKIADLPFEMYSWAALPSSLDRIRKLGVLQKMPDLRITDLGLHIPVVVVGFSQNIVQTHDVNPVFLSRCSKVVSAILKFERNLANQERNTAIKQGPQIGPSEREEAALIDPLYLRNYVDVMLLTHMCGMDWVTKQTVELQQLSFDPKRSDINVEQVHFDSLSALLADDFFDLDGDNVEAEASQKVANLWQNLKAYIVFFDALVEHLLGPEWMHKSKELDEDWRVSRIVNNSGDGSTWIQLITLPDVSVAGDYWLVRPSIVHSGAKPSVVKHSGIDIRLGSTWAVKAISIRSKSHNTIENLADERAISLKIWSNRDKMVAGDQEETRRHDNEELELQMVSRSIKLFPAGEWQLPMYIKDAIVHG